VSDWIGNLWSLDGLDFGKRFSGDGSEVTEAQPVFSIIVIA
jgi:hypothetical protein